MKKFKLYLIDYLMYIKIRMKIYTVILLNISTPIIKIWCKLLI